MATTMTMAVMTTTLGKDNHDDNKLQKYKAIANAEDNVSGEAYDRLNKIQRINDMDYNKKLGVLAKKCSIIR